MKTLFNSRLIPLTFSIGFLEQSLPNVRDAYCNWIRTHGTTFDVMKAKADFQLALRQLEPLTMPRNRFLWRATDSQWTAYFDNGSRGADPVPPISYLAEHLGCRGVVATYVPQTLSNEIGNSKGTYGAIQLELFAPTRRKFLNYERTISVAYDDGKWRFDANGTIQPFENVKQYSARRVADRFTGEMLQEYCHSLGIRLIDEDFYVGDGILFVKNDPRPSGAVELSLEDAARELLPLNRLKTEATAGESRNADA